MSSESVCIVLSGLLVGPMAGICGAVWYRLCSVKDATAQYRSERDTWIYECARLRGQLDKARDLHRKHRDRCRQLRKELREARGGGKLKVRT